MPFPTGAPLEPSLYISSRVRDIRLQHMLTNEQTNEHTDTPTITTNGNISRRG